MSVCIENTLTTNCNELLEPLSLLFHYRCIFRKKNWGRGRIFRFGYDNTPHPYSKL